jgi:hypothetical protein
MSNMGYCRFENTLRDLQDCYENIEETDLSATESSARKNLIELCVDIALDFGGDVGRDCEEV